VFGDLIPIQFNNDILSFCFVMVQCVPAMPIGGVSAATVMLA